MRIGVDIGGTFTDVVVFDDEDGSVRLAKSLSTPDDLARGVREALVRSGADLRSARSLIHGSTIV
ncbi:MAG TPA: hydantoinase/oxoprolinase N-terminal domain-containing protein, partial [Chloroflexota bacterium]